VCFYRNNNHSYHIYQNQAIPIGIVPWFVTCHNQHYIIGVTGEHTRGTDETNVKNVVSSPVQETKCKTINSRLVSII
jgi:hypothetical protein